MSDEFKLQWSVSLPPVAQYAKGHMFNFRGNTVEELNDLFDTVLAAETIDKALSVADLLTAGAVVKSNLGAPAPQESSSAPDATVTQLRTCAHGKRQYRTGNGAKGKWEGYFCPLDKNDPNKCDVDWVNNR